MVNATIAGLSAGGETEGEAEISALAGVFVVPNVQIGVTVSYVELAGFDGLGSFGGFASFNFGSADPLVGFVGGSLGVGLGFDEPLSRPLAFQVFGGVRVMTRGGGGALVIRPFYERVNFDGFLLPDLNRYGVALGASLIFGGR